MNRITNALLAIGGAAITAQVGRMISRVDIDQVLGRAGLMRQRNHQGGSLAALGAGVLVGGALGVLFAPASGRRVRARLLRWRAETPGTKGDRVKGTSPARNSEKGRGIDADGSVAG